jgi:thymidine phosphorylase
VIDDPERLPSAPCVESFVSAEAGFVTAVGARQIGQTVVAMGGGRQTMADSIDPAVGIEILVRPGDRVEPSQPLATIHANSTETMALAQTALGGAITVNAQRGPPALPLISHRVTSNGVEILG